MFKKFIFNLSLSSNFLTPTLPLIEVIFQMSALWRASENNIRPGHGLQKLSETPTFIINDFGSKIEVTLLNSLSSNIYLMFWPKIRYTDNYARHYTPVVPMSQWHLIPSNLSSVKQSPQILDNCAFVLKYLLKAQKTFSLPWHSIKIQNTKY